MAPRSPWVPSQPDTPNIVPPPEPVTVVEPERATHDLLIDTHDRGPGAAMLITAGYPIPDALRDRPRRRADGQPDTPKRRR